MDITDGTIPIYHTAQRHAPQLEEVDLLPVLQRDPVIGIRQTGEGNSFILPVLLETGRWIGTDGQDHHTTAGKFLVLIPQARQLRAAVWSLKAAQESQYDRPAPKFR